METRRITRQRARQNNIDQSNEYLSDTEEMESSSEDDIDSDDSASSYIVPRGLLVPMNSRRRRTIYDSPEDDDDDDELIAADVENIQSTYFTESDDTDVSFAPLSPAIALSSDEASGPSEYTITSRSNSPTEDIDILEGDSNSSVGGNNEPIEIPSIPSPNNINSDNNEENSNPTLVVDDGSSHSNANSEVRVSDSKDHQASLEATAGCSSLYDQSMNDDEGQTCSICFESWSNSGEHRLCSLKCGHIFGKLCIEKWLQSTNNRCPQCNSKATKRDIRIIFAKALKAVDTSDKDRLAKQLAECQSKNATLESEKAKILLKNQLDSQKLRQLQEELNMLRNSINRDTLPLTEGLGQEPNALRRTPEFKLSFYRTFELTKDGHCRVMAYNEWMSMLVVSVSSQISLFSGYGIKKVNILDMRLDKFIPMHQKEIRDLDFNPERKDYLLSVSVDKTAKVMNVENNSVIGVFPADQPLWSCCWNTDQPTKFFVGSVTGVVYRYDILQITQPPITYTVVGSGPIISLSYLPATQGRFYPGLLVTKLDTICYLELINNEVKTNKLPIEGRFVHTSYDSRSEHILVTSRPTQRNVHAKHTIYQIQCNFEPINNDCETNRTISTNDVYSFQGGTTMKVLARSRLFPNPKDNKDSIVLFSEENSRTSKLYDMRSTSLLQTFKTNDNVIDIMPISCHNNHYIALLMDKKINFYKWVEQL